MLHATTVMSKSAHMRFVYSRCHLELFFGGYALDRRCDFRSLIELGECGLPWTIFSPRLLYIPHQFIEAFSCVVPGTLVVHMPHARSMGLALGQ